MYVVCNILIEKVVIGEDLVNVIIGFLVVYILDLVKFILVIFCMKCIVFNLIYF